MHASDWNFHSMAIRHLAAVYGIVIATQAGYFAWLLSRWLKLDTDTKKAPKPVN